ncbi:DUF4145 domain-containing protein [Caballeronia sp. GAWG1-5s-s]|uniref:DUF4145 domain-containing protein n=1 Tax=Caballeronia sp. GAWG1-5s-s TaxID=2921743 RepID=UPI002541F447|nr:DUF4145 domain-containing protein [Caballeronia sp. GAWG1-5s-s]
MAEVFRDCRFTATVRRKPHSVRPGDSINAQIGDLVKQGMPAQIQQALDVVRVVGNNAVHPGKMDPEDVAEISASLFALVNLIVEDRITRPKMVADVFAALPEGARKAIDRRDGK